MKPDLMLTLLSLLRKVCYCGNGHFSPIIMKTSCVLTAISRNVVFRKNTIGIDDAIRRQFAVESDLSQRRLRNDNTISESDNGNCRLFEEI